ncbi:MAG: fructose-bisphosphatase class II, partial [Deltaproteobacteria bacterium]|nr:fructose-bisphosphatase class II [Deltaproteobacteria bacterium]
GSLSVLAAGGSGKILHAPDVYMNKIAVGPKAADAINIQRSIEENCRNVADALSKNLEDLRVIVLDRPRHEKIVRNLRDLGARVIFIRDGDVSAALSTCFEGSGIDMMMGIGGSPEGVLAAAALKCLGGNILGQLLFNRDEEKERAFRLGITEFNRIYSLEDMVSGNVVFCATGVTSGDLLNGIQMEESVFRTHSIVMRSENLSVSYITTEYPKER